MRKWCANQYSDNVGPCIRVAGHMGPHRNTLGMAWDSDHARAEKWMKEHKWEPYPENYRHTVGSYREMREEQAARENEAKEKNKMMEKEKSMTERHWHRCSDISREDCDGHICTCVCGAKWRGGDWITEEDTMVGTKGITIDIDLPEDVYYAAKVAANMRGETLDTWLVSTLRIGLKAAKLLPEDKEGWQK